MFALMGVLVQGNGKLIGEGYRHNVYPQEDEESGLRRNPLLLPDTETPFVSK